VVELISPTCEKHTGGAPGGVDIDSCITPASFNSVIVTRRVRERFPIED
jgi:hypothetical protein